MSKIIVGVTQELLTQVVEALNASFEFEGQGIKVFAQDVVKNNGQHLHGLVFQTEGVKHGITVSPTLYLEGYDLDRPADEIADKIREDYLRFTQDQTGSGAAEAMVLAMQERESFLSMLRIGVISTSRNRELLSGLVSWELVGDLSAYLVLCREDNTCENARLTAKVKPELLKKVGVSLEEAVQAAVRNCLGEVVIKNILEVLKELRYEELWYVDIPEDEIPMFVVTNTSNVGGAAYLAVPEVFKGLADKFDSDLYILPSSINEVMCIPCCMGDCPAEMTGMVREINASGVLPQEVLSDEVYRYSRETGKVTLA